MTDEEIEKALKDRAYQISYSDDDRSKGLYIAPKDKLSQETLAYIERLKEACQSAIQSYTRMETLYKVKCTELDCAKEQVRKDTAKEIFQTILDDYRGVDYYSFLFEGLQAIADDEYGIRIMPSENGVSVEVDDD